MTRRLSKEAIKRIREMIEAERECGNEQLSTDLEILLEWHLESVRESEDKDSGSP